MPNAAPARPHCPETRRGEVIALAHQTCRRCGCPVRGKGYEKNDVTYCCESCAERFECECGCIDMGDGG